jgi:hypothetical protein
MIGSSALRRKSLHKPFGISRAVRSALSSLWVGRRPIGTQKATRFAGAPHFEERSGKNEAHRLSAPTLARFSERLLVTGGARLVILGDLTVISLGN